MRWGAPVGSSPIPQKLGQASCARACRQYAVRNEGQSLRPHVPLPHIRSAPTTANCDDDVSRPGGAITVQGGRVKTGGRRIDSSHRIRARAPGSRPGWMKAEACSRKSQRRPRGRPSAHRPRRPRMRTRAGALSSPLRVSTQRQRALHRPASSRAPSPGGPWTAALYFGAPSRRPDSLFRADGPGCLEGARSLAQ